MARIFLNMLKHADSKFSVNIFCTYRSHWIVRDHYFWVHPVLLLGYFTSFLRIYQCISNDCFNVAKITFIVWINVKKYTFSQISIHVQQNIELSLLVIIHDRGGNGKKGPANYETNAKIQNFHIIHGIYGVLWYALELHTNFSIMR